tara:strand:+ start:2125 stop:2832 length:708 start_codon:yes stop_codon:yes gene_type:complete
MKKYNQKEIFTKSFFSTKDKLKNFSKYVRRQDLARFMVFFELFKKQMDAKGSIVECGVHQGGGMMTWAKLSSILEPYNYHRKVIGFDTFSGIPSLAKFDKNKKKSKKITFKEKFDVMKDIKSCIKEYDQNRFINNIPKIELIKGDAKKTIPKYVKKNRHLLISLLYFDFVVYQPTKVALKYFLPRMSKGSIIAFNELNNEDWPGETTALLEKLNVKKFKIDCFPYEPNISYIIIK